MSATIYLLTLGLPLATVLIVFAMRSYAAVQQAKAHMVNNEALRQLNEGQADILARLTSIEKILKEVE